VIATRPIPPDELAIVGGGCAGLSLAVRLLDRFPDARVTIFDPRRSYENDRSWCFWDFGDDPRGYPIAHRWTSAIVRGPGREVELDCAGRPYCHVRAGDFYEWALERLRASGRATLELGAAVREIDDTLAGVIVRATSHDGRAFDRAFSMVFDGRPPERGGSAQDAASLTQAFVGHEVEFDEDVLDSERVTLMDFRVDQSRGLRFVYVLPFTPRRGLVETTYLTPGLDQASIDEREITDYCETTLGRPPCGLIRVERGALPMTTAPLGPPSTRHIWRIGTRAGIARASTGYAFDAIQRDAARVCDALAARGPRPAAPRPRLLNTLDRMMLSLLASRPEVGPRLFESMFSRAPAGALIRFLSDRASVGDALAVVRSVPKVAMTSHVLARPGLCVGA
jgi:lycopene beta-cyclase